MKHLDFIEFYQNFPVIFFANRFVLHTFSIVAN